MFDYNEITVTNRYGWAILHDIRSGKAMVAEPTMAGPDIIAFHIVRRCEDYHEALLLTVALNEGGVYPNNYGEEGADDATQQDGSAEAPTITGEVMAAASGATRT
jgi:hypothetical protein